MDEALIEHAQHDIDGDGGGEDQPRLALQRAGELGRIAGIAAEDRRRHADIFFRLRDHRDRVAQRGARREVEADRHRGELLLMRDRQRRGDALEAGEGGERHLRIDGAGRGARRGAARGAAAGAGLRAGGRRCRRGRGGAGARHIEPRQRTRILLLARQRLEDHAILVRLAVDGRDLPLAERIVERIRHGLHADAEPAGLFAVDIDVDARPAVLCFGCDFAQDRRFPQLRRQRIGPLVDLLRIAAGERVLILRATGAGADLDILHRLEIDGHARDVRDRLFQPLDDRLDAGAALVARLERDRQLAGVRRGVNRADADDRDDVGHVRVAADRVLHLLLPPRHLDE